jgi:hypothetical protein
MDTVVEAGAARLWRWNCSMEGILDYPDTSSVVTPTKGTDTRFKNKYGVYVVESEVRKANSTMSIRGKCSLGRPWVRFTVKLVA